MKDKVKPKNKILRYQLYGRNLESKKWFSIGKYNNLYDMGKVVNISHKTCENILKGKSSTLGRFYKVKKILKV